MCAMRSRLTTELCLAVKLKNNMENPKLKACPFCGEEYVVLISVNHLKQPTTHQCYCDYCNARGPIAVNLEKAKGLWEARAGGRESVMSETGGTKGVGISDLLSGAGLIATERLRQKQQKGYTDEHDDAHVFGDITDAAICYAFHAAHRSCLGVEDYKTYLAPDEWPFEWSAWKPKSPIEDLVRAGALIAAEIDRVKRIKAIKPDNSVLSNPKPDSTNVNDLDKKT